MNFLAICVQLLAITYFVLLIYSLLNKEKERRKLMSRSEMYVDLVRMKNCMEKIVDGYSLNSEENNVADEENLKNK